MLRRRSYFCSSLQSLFSSPFPVQRFSLSSSDTVTTTTTPATTLDVSSGQVITQARSFFPGSRLPAAVEKIIPKHREKILADHTKMSALGLPPAEPISALGREVEEVIYRLSLRASAQGPEVPTWVPLQQITKCLSDEHLEALDGYHGGLRALIERQLTERTVLVRDSKTKAVRVRYVAIQPQLIQLLDAITPALLESGLYRDIKDFGVISCRIDKQLRSWCEKHHSNIAKAIYAGYRRVPNLPFTMEKRKFDKQAPLRFSLKRDHPLVKKALKEASERASRTAKEFSRLFQSTVAIHHTTPTANNINNHHGGINFHEMNDEHDFEGGGGGRSQHHSHGEEAVGDRGGEEVSSNRSGGGDDGELTATANAMRLLQGEGFVFDTHSASGKTVGNSLTSQPGQSLVGRLAVPPTRSTNASSTFCLNYETDGRSLKSVKTPFTSAGATALLANKNSHSHNHNNSDTCSTQEIQDEIHEDEIYNSPSSTVTMMTQEERIQERQRLKDLREQEKERHIDAIRRPKKVAIGLGGFTGPDLTGGLPEAPQFGESDSHNWIHFQERNKQMTLQVADNRRANPVGAHEGSNKTFLDGTAATATSTSSLLVDEGSQEQDQQQKRKHTSRDEEAAAAAEAEAEGNESAASIQERVESTWAIGDGKARAVAGDAIPAITFTSFVRDIRNAASLQKDIQFGPHLMVPYVPSFFVPISEVVKLIEPEGYTYEHFDSYFVKSSRNFQVISLGDKPNQKFIRCHGHGGDFDLTECVTIAARRPELSKFEPKPAFAAPFLKVFADTHTSPGQWMPLHVLFEKAGDEAVKRLPPYFSNGVANDASSTVAPNPTTQEHDEADIRFKNLAPLLYFSQLLHLFNFSAEEGGMVCRVSPDQVSLVQENSPCAALVNHLIRGLWNQSVQGNVFESHLLPKPLLHQGQELFPSWQALVFAHRSLFVYNPQTQFLSLKRHLDREMLKDSGTLEDQLRFASRNRNPKDAHALRRKIALKNAPDHPLATSQGFADYIYSLLPENDWLPLAKVSRLIPQEAMSYMPKKGLFHIVSRFPNHFRLFDLERSAMSSSHSSTKADGSVAGHAATTFPCLCRAHLPPPEGAITEDNFSERDLVKHIVRFFVQNHHFSNQTSVLVDVMMKKIPISSRLEISTAETLVNFLKKLPNHFVLMSVYSDNTEIRLVKLPDDEDYELFSDKPLSKLDEYESM